MTVLRRGVVSVVAVRRGRIGVSHGVVQSTRIGMKIAAGIVPDIVGQVQVHRVSGQSEQGQQRLADQDRATQDGANDEHGRHIPAPSCEFRKDRRGNKGRILMYPAHCVCRSERHTECAEYYLPVLSIFARQSGILRDRTVPTKRGGTPESHPPPSSFEPPSIMRDATGNVKSRGGGDAKRQFLDVSGGR